MLPMTVDAAISSSSQQAALAATTDKRNKPRCNFSSNKEAKFCISFSSLYFSDQQQLQLLDSSSIVYE